MLKQSDSEVTRDSNGNTVSSVQSSSMDESEKIKSEPYVQVLPVLFLKH